jgi:hypothetical protein
VQSRTVLDFQWNFGIEIWAFLGRSLVWLFFEKLGIFPHLLVALPSNHSVMQYFCILFFQIPIACANRQTAPGVIDLGGVVGVIDLGVVAVGVGVVDLADQTLQLAPALT